MDAHTRRRPAPLVLLLFGAAIGLLVGMVWAVLTPVAYAATAKAYVATQAVSTGDLEQGSDRAQQAARSYADIAVSPIVLDAVIRDLSLRTTSEALGQQVAVAPEPGTVVLEIRASDPSPERAAAIANAVTASLQRASSSLAPATAGAATTTITPIRPAVVPSSPATPAPVAAVLGGLLGGTGVAALALLASWLWRRRPPAGGSLAAPSLL